MTKNVKGYHIDDTSTYNKEKSDLRTFLPYKFFFSKILQILKFNLYLCTIVKESGNGQRSDLSNNKDVFERLSLCITNLANP